MQNRFVIAVALSGSVYTAACGDRPNNSGMSRSGSTVSAGTTVSGNDARQDTIVMTMFGPSIDVDSAITEPRLDVSNKTYIVRLPTAAARVLLDSLPGFSPLQLTRYPQAVTPPFTYLHADVELPSVVLGDFNGDSRLDIAMEGRSNQTVATAILLSVSPTNPRPQIFVVNKRHVASPDTVGYLGLLHAQEIKDPYSNVAIKLHADAVQRVVPYQSSTVYYVEGGTLKQYVYAGD